MNITTRRFSTAAAAILLAVTGSFAQTESTQPNATPSGIMNVDDYPEGANTFLISGAWTINRDATGYISLYRDDVLIRQIPASNEQYLYTGHDEGFTSIRQDNDNIRVVFWNTTNSPAGLVGEYKMVVPAGFVYADNNKAAVNEEWTFTLSCIGSDSSAFTVTPEPNKLYTSLDEFTITLPNTVNYRFAATLPEVSLEDFYDTTPDGEEVDLMKCTVTVDGNTATIRPNGKITHASTYVLTIPDGFIEKKVVLDEQEQWQPVAMIEYRYQLTQAISKPAIVPAENQTLEYISSTEQVVVFPPSNLKPVPVFFTLTLDEDIMYSLMGRPIWCPVLEDGTPDTSNGTKLSGGCNLVGNDEYPGDRRKYYVYSSDLATELLPTPGKYALVIPNGCFSVKTEDGGFSNNPELVYYYEIGVNSNFEVLISPANGTVTKQLQYFTVTFDEGVEIGYRENTFAQLTNGIAVYSMRGKLTPGITNEIHFDLPIPLTENGTWVFTTPNTEFTANGNNVSASGTYTITDELPEVDKTCVVTPAAGTVAELTDFHITFAAHEGFFGREGGGGISLVRLPDTDVALDNPGYYDFDNNYYVIALTEATKVPGEYVLTILPNTFWVGEENGFANDEVKVNYVINESSESVDSIELENARGDVFNAAGIRVAADVTLDDVLRLDKGLYIFCGRKIIVK